MVVGKLHKAVARVNIATHANIKRVSSVEGTVACMHLPRAKKRGRREKEGRREIKKVRVAYPKIYTDCFGTKL